MSILIANKKRIYSSFLLVLLCTMSLTARQVYDIYPVPHSQVATGAYASFRGNVNIVAGSSIDDVTISRAQEICSANGIQTVVTSAVAKGKANIILGVYGSKDVADRMASKNHLDTSVFGLQKFDRHILNLSASKEGLAQLLIMGEDTDAVFYGLASLEQILDRGTERLDCVDIIDYADIKNRGVIEGYYGVPYSADVTKDLFRFMARYKLNTYMYGAKSDPYHSQFWSEPYPETISAEQEAIGYLSAPMLKEITDVAHACKVNFIWAIHPGTAFTDPEDKEVNADIMDKFEHMYDLGVRQFGVFVDDVGVPEEEEILKLGADRLTDLQKRIDDKWNRQGRAPADTVKPLHYVPQLYAYGWAYEDEARQFFSFLSDTPDKVNIYITGRAVWSVPNNKDLSTVKEYLGRPVSWWWNYPCNDNDMTKLFPMDMYSNFKDEKHIDNLAKLEPLDGASTVIINPMQQGEVSKISLFSVADFTWNNAAFNNDVSWASSFKAIFGEKYAALVKYLVPYLRYFDRDVLAYDVTRYKDSVASGTPSPRSLINRFTKVADACVSIKEMAVSENESDRLFYKDIRPWVCRLESMCREAIDLLSGNKAVDYGTQPRDDFQFKILSGMGEEISLSVIEAEPSHEVLQPFIEWLRQNN